MVASATIKSNQTLPKHFYPIILEETNIKKIKWLKSNTIKVILDTKLTPRLLEEGAYRDFVRSIQNLRKKQALNLNDKIKITAPDWPINFQTQILQKTLAVSIQKGNSLKIQKV